MFPLWKKEKNRSKKKVIKRYSVGQVDYRKSLRRYLLLVSKYFDQLYVLTIYSTTYTYITYKLYFQSSVFTLTVSA